MTAPTFQTIRPRLTMKKMGVKQPKTAQPITDDTFGLKKLYIYYLMWNALQPFRKERERIAKYVSGDQWHEITVNDYGEAMREDDLINDQGSPALKQNLIRSALDTVLGQYRSDSSKSVVVSRTQEKGKASEMLSNALQYSSDTINDRRELNARAIEEMWISGVCIQRKSVEYQTEIDKSDVFVTNVHPNTIFFNGDIMDIRGKDIRCIGRLIDFTLEEVIVRFGTTPQREEKLRQIYSTQRVEYVNLLGLDAGNTYNKNFYIPLDMNKCRVIEVWEKRLTKRTFIQDWMDGAKYYSDYTEKDLEMINNFRIAKYAAAGTPPEEVPLMEMIRMENVMVWYGSYYTPYGHILEDQETPFWHRSHPFEVGFCSLFDGQIKGKAHHLIDSQRQINRLFILQDMILRSSMKNTLIVDSNSLKGTSLEKVSEGYRKVGGVVALNLKQGEGQPPIELKGSIGNLGIPEMIQLYIRMMQDVSGVNPALQGQQAPSGTSGTLYAQQAQNSTLNSKDIMDSFSSFRRRMDMKVLKTIQQFYDTKRMLAISGKSYTETAQLYDPEVVRDCEFDLVIGQTSDSPVYRTMIDDKLFRFVELGLMDLELFLENTTMPFSSQLLDSIRRRKEQAASNPQAAVQGLAGDAQAAGVGGNQQVVDQAYRGIKAA